MTQSQLSKPPQVSTGNLADVTTDVAADQTNTMGSGLLGDGETLTLKADKMIEARNRKNNDLAIRSR